MKYIPIFFPPKVAPYRRKTSENLAEEGSESSGFCAVLQAADQQCNMASRESSFSRTEIQQEIKKHGDVLRQLKLKEPTDEVKNKVTL